MRACRPSSSLITRVSYDDETGVLAIAFASGRSYAYTDVPEAIYRELCNADSPGRFYNERVKGGFACREVSPRRRFRPLEA